MSKWKVEIPINDNNIYCVNKIYGQKYFDNEFKNNLPKFKDIEVIFDLCNTIFAQNQDIDKATESQLEHIIILPIIKLLGWNHISQELKINFGQELKPDFVLFSDEILYKKYVSINNNERHGIWDGVDVILETKKINTKLDTNKVTRDNPFMQMMDYFQILKVLIYLQLSI
jgi:hypothetical protein